MVCLSNEKRGNRVVKSTLKEFKFDDAAGEHKCSPNPIGVVTIMK